VLTHEVLLLRAYGSQFVGYEHGMLEKPVNVLLKDKVKSYHRRIETYFFHLGRKL